MFKIEAREENGLFEDLLSDRFATLETAIAATVIWDYPDTMLHILDIENQCIVWANYTNDPNN